MTDTPNLSRLREQVEAMTPLVLSGGDTDERAAANVTGIVTSVRLARVLADPKTAEQMADTIAAHVSISRAGKVLVAEQILEQLAALAAEGEKT